LQQAYARRHQAVGHQVAVGAGLQFLGIGLRTVITIGSTAVLARLLSPSDFGLVAMATVVTELAGLLGAFGLANMLVQRRVINRLQLDTVFWASLGLGTLIAGVVLLLSFAAGWLFAAPDVGRLLRLLCLNFVLNSLTAVPWAVLARLMRYQTDFWIQLTVVVVRTAAAILSAWAGLGMWSLVVGALVGSGVNAALGLRAARYWPRFRMHWPVLANSWRTSSSYLGNALLHYTNSNLDLMLIGRTLGATALGYYQNARALTDEIRGRIAMPIQHVLFPAFSALQTDPAAFRRLVLRASRLLSAVVIPVGFGVSALAELLVRVLYGPKWLPMVVVMSMFGFSAAIRASAAISIPLFNATDRVGLALRYNLVGTALLLCAVLVAMPWGVEAVAMGVALASLYPLVSMRAAYALIGLRLADLVAVLGPPLVAAGLMWLLGQWLNGLRAIGPHDGAAELMGRLLWQACACGTLYLVALTALSAPLRQEVADQLHILRGRRQT
jgi:PST family polysaccharide transporter